MKRTYRPWTREEIERAVALREMGLGCIRIGKELGRAPTSVDHRLKRETGEFHSLGRQCVECGAPVSDRSKGRCKPCFLTHMNTDAEIKEKRVEALRSSPALQPGAAPRMIAGRKSGQTRAANPEYMERLREHVRTKMAPLGNTPEAHAKRDWDAIARKISERYMSWCPEEYRDLYRLLIRNKGYNKAEAQQIIRAQIKADLASLSPFERQERALANGAQLYANDQKPSLANPGFYEERRAG